MNKKIILTTSILWTALAAIAFLVYFFPFKHQIDGFIGDIVYTESEDAVYVAENEFDNAVIFKLDEKGTKKGVFIGNVNKTLNGYKVCAATYNQSLFVIFSCEALYDGKDVTAYRIARFGENMALAQLSDLLILGGEIKITYLSSDDKDLYISATNNSGTEGYVYRFSIDAVKDLKSEEGSGLKNIKSRFSGKENSKGKIEVDKESFSEITPFVFEVSDSGRYYSWWAYEPGELHSCYDNEKPEAFFNMSGRVYKSYRNHNISAYDYNRMRGLRFMMIIIIWLIGIPVIVILTLILKGKNRAFYLGFGLELVLLLIFGLGAVGIIRSVSKLNMSEHEEFAEYIINDTFSGLDLNKAGLDFELTGSAREKMLKDFYDSEIYSAMCKELKNLNSLSNDEWEISELVILNRTSGEVIVSDSYKNRVQASVLLSNDIASFAQTSNVGSGTRSKDFNIGSEKCSVLVRSLDGVGLEDCTLIAVVRYPESFDLIMSKYKKYIRLSIIGFIIASLVVIIILFFENRDIHAVAKMLKSLAEGRGVVNNPSVHGKDIVAIKNSAFEIEKNITSMNRSKYKIFEAYYRFAPKSIENILKKDSITEVEIGDRSDITGTVAILSMKEGRRMDEDSLAYMNKTFEIMEKYREEYHGIYITNNETLSKARLLFPENNKKAISFGVDLLNSLREWKKREYADTLVLLHYTTFSYGICGTETQSMALLSSRDIEKLSSIAEWLRDMRLSMVVTGDVLKNESGYGEVRFLGFVRTEGNKRFDLYEIIGAQGSRLSSAKKKTKDAFEAAVQMFYDKDFYLARNAFTDILRETPFDGLAKWYLFECETQLNGDAEGAFTGELHI
ncbi:MAG: hypothetical protein IJT72_10785 [Lachnospiraceae bacterium]|nr:hypothetical protein [Lachnospiraceae bacterium]